ncbi:MAG: zinc ABC transporter substrate-binding protein [Bacteroidales bacterium]|nr:zinc ABC transporter substrate-binding protein [Bacteroidales bacterium]
MKNNQPSITVSILPHKYLVERIVGDHFKVNVLTPPGANHETYEPTTRQIKELSDADLLVINGFLLFEDNLAKKFGRSPSVKLVDLSHGVNLISSEVVQQGNHVHLHGVDPHFWLSPAEVKVMARNMLHVLTALTPDNAELFESNYQGFMNDIDTLDAFIRQSFSDLRTRTFLIYHPALSYFARDYDLNQVAIEMEGKEPTVQHMKKIADLAMQEHIKTVFIQSQFSIATARAVAHEIGGKVVTLNPVPENWLESMYEMTRILHQAMIE